MNIFPAIDLVGGKAVRLFKGDYAQMTVYSDNPLEVAKDFERQGAKHIHLVDLEGAKDGTTPNLRMNMSYFQPCRYTHPYFRKKPFLPISRDFLYIRC